MLCNLFINVLLNKKMISLKMLVHKNLLQHIDNQNKNKKNKLRHFKNRKLKWKKSLIFKSSLNIITNSIQI